MQKEASIAQVLFQVYQDGHLQRQELSLRPDLGEEYLAELEGSLRKEGYDILEREPFRLVYALDECEYVLSVRPVVTVSIDLMDHVTVRTYPEDLIV